MMNREYVPNAARMAVILEGSAMVKKDVRFGGASKVEAQLMRATGIDLQGKAYV
jgi:hypothetical protein